MKKLSILSLIAILALSITGCKKKGQFTTDKETYKQGEVITVTNETEKSAKYYSWTFGGVEVQGENPVYTIPESTPVGSFEISILPKNSQGTTDSWKRNSKTVMVEEGDFARVTFYIVNPRTGNQNETFSVNTPDGQVYGGSVINYTPTCGVNVSGAIVFENLPAGDFDYQVLGSSSSGSYNLTGTVTLESGSDCQRVDIATL